MGKSVYLITVNGIPKAQPRPRMTKAGHVYTPDSAKAWKEQIIAEFLLHRKPIIDKPVKLVVDFLFPFPKSVKNPQGYVPHTIKPDSDNLLKVVMDAATAANVWIDDSQVYYSHAEKWFYAGASGVTIKIEVGR